MKFTTSSGNITSIRKRRSPSKTFPCRRRQSLDRHGPGPGQWRRNRSPSDGNGQLNAVSNAICKAYGIEFENLVYSEHDLDGDSDSRGIAYFGLTDKKGQTTWGAGIDTDTMTASIRAFVTAVNRMEGMDQRVRFRHFASAPQDVAAFKAAASQH